MNNDKSQNSPYQSPLVSYVKTDLQETVKRLGCIQNRYKSRLDVLSSGRLSTNSRSQFPSRDKHPVDERVQKKAKDLLNQKINDLNKDLHTRYRNVIENERSQFMKKIRQHGSDKFQERTPQSRELLKREMMNYNMLWKNKENSVKRNISYVIQKKQRDEWKMPLLIREAKEEIKREKQARTKRIFSKVQALSKMQLLGLMGGGGIAQAKAAFQNQPDPRKLFQDKSLIKSQATMIAEKPRSKRDGSPRTTKNNSTMALQIENLFYNAQPIKRLSVIKINTRDLKTFLNEALQDPDL
ncbi:UNKNOWN [Stylonychia lemnae]|uniref:Uncharacterized protein n=1 Tax=Stylonychia lemnae TaxID=5949 RepID=A0A077ZZM9_STYLE|nr:UNKNOWN [Stylonychia lemnae]|eukprot:CDW75067.1 UNKNOWN [Stylonychia lemnae]